MRSFLIVCVLLCAAIPSYSQDVEIPSNAAYRYDAAKVHYLFLDSRNLTSAVPKDYNFSEQFSGRKYRYFDPSSTAFGYATCQIFLPDSARITELTGWIYDNDPGNYVELNLYEFSTVDLTNPEQPIGGHETFGTIQTLVTDASTNVQELSVTTDKIVDNSDHIYILRFLASERNLDLRFYHARIKYEVSKAQ